MAARPSGAAGVTAPTGAYRVPPSPPDRCRHDPRGRIGLVVPKSHGKSTELSEAEPHRRFFDQSCVTNLQRLVRIGPLRQLASSFQPWDLFSEGFVRCFVNDENGDTGRAATDPTKSRSPTPTSSGPRARAIATCLKFEELRVEPSELRELFVRA